MFASRYMPCPECGASLDRAERDSHTCQEERRLDFLMFQLRDEIAALDEALRAYLDSPEGRFLRYCAERERRRGHR